MSRNGTEKVAQLLEKEGFDVAAYHAGMSNEQREITQDDFINDRVQIICGDHLHSVWELTSLMSDGSSIITCLRV